MSLIYGTGKSNSLIHIPEDIKVETNPTGVRVIMLKLYLKII